MTLRRTGLKPGRPLARGGPLRPVSEKRREEFPSLRSTFAPKVATGAPRRTGHRVPADVTRLVKERSEGLCEIGLPGCWRSAVEKHHRISQKAGGRHGAAARRSDRCSNLVHVCLYCHTAVTLHPHLVAARSNGWVLRERDEPAQHPVLYRGELSYLDDDGSVHSFDKAGA